MSLETNEQDSKYLTIREYKKIVEVTEDQFGTFGKFQVVERN
jgi:hypothetical protein